MFRPDFRGKTALVTGATRGLGLAAGLALGEMGAQVVLTHKWGGDDHNAILERFRDRGAPKPIIITADAALEEDTRHVVNLIGDAYGRLDFFVNNVCVTSRGGSLENLKSRDISQSLKYSAWPILTYVKEIRHRFGSPPQKIISMSSDGPDHHYPFYDYVAVSKAALEALTRRLAVELRGKAGVFILRARQVSTDSFSEMFPAASKNILSQAFSSFEIEPDAVGRSVVALCSGYLDGLHGETLCIDKGATFYDNVLSAGPVLMEALEHGKL